MALKSATIVTLSTGLNLLLTLGNQVVLAYLFGANTSMDAFLACGAVPFVVLNLAIGDLGYILIPLLMQYRSSEVRRAIGSTLNAVLGISAVVTLLGLLEHRTILRLTTASSMPSATFALAVSIAPLMWGVIGLTVVSSYLTGLHHYYRLFTAAAVTLALPYLGMILWGLAAARYAGIHAVVWGWFVGTLARTAILFVTLPRPWPTLYRFRHPATTALLRSLFPLGVSLLPFVALPMIDVFWASRLPVGSISYLGYSTRIVIAISSIVVQGLSVVLFPDLSENALQGQLLAFRAKLRHAVEAIFAFIVPLASLAYLLDGALLVALLQRGRFTASSSHGVLHVLPFYLLGTLWMAMMNIISRSYFALRSYVVPALTGLLALIVYVGISGALIGRYSYAGIGVAYVVFWIFLFFLQLRMLERRLGPLLTGPLMRFMAAVLLCAGVAILASLGCTHLLPKQSGVLVHVAIASVSFLVFYLLISVKLFHIRHYPELFHALRLGNSDGRVVGAEVAAGSLSQSLEGTLFAGTQVRENT